MLAGIACPISLLEECAAQGHYHMALSHLILKSEVYRSFYLRMSQRGDFVSVDNGVVEKGKALPLVSVLEAAHMVRAQEVVLPDVLYDGPKTLYVVSEAWEYLTMHGCIQDFRWLAVPHGRTFREWLECYLQLLMIDAVDTIGVSMFDHDLLPGGRPQILSVLEELQLVDSTKDYHMLGCWKDLRETWFLAHRYRVPTTPYGESPGKRTWIRSMDTGVPVRVGLMNGQYYPLDEPQMPLPVTHRGDDFFAAVVMNDAIQHNIDLYKTWCEE